MKILILGAHGQVGWELARTLPALAPVDAWDRASADLEDLDGLAAKVRRAAPAIIVNAAAYTDVDRAESEPGRAYRVNAEAVEVLSACAKELDGYLIHYSTDYVFDGTKESPYVETDRPNPLGVYGQTKLAGEEAIRRSGCRHLLFRTSWVFAARGRNFPRTILRRAAEEEELRIVEDQFGAPTRASLIAGITRRALERVVEGKPGEDGPAGTYHIASRGETSWYEYARFLLEEALKHGYKTRLRGEGILPIPTSEFPRPAMRPGNSRLNTGKLESWLGVTPEPWQTGVAAAVREIVSEREPVP